MNEAETRAELIDPELAQAGWGVVEGSKISREYKITAGRIQAGGRREKPLSADYLLVYRGMKLAVVEAKSDEQEVGEGVAQAKRYASMLKLRYTYAANGREIYAIDMESGKEGLVSSLPGPDELWARVYGKKDEWRDLFNALPFNDMGGTKDARYYQELAVNRTMDAIASGKDRILLTLATGTGKTFIAFQIAWKLFQARWHLARDGARRPRILFLADRNILADQAFNDFSAFPEDALARIRPDEIRKKGRVPTNGSVFFTIFQTFMSGQGEDGKPEPYFGEYPSDYFDFIIIDECHRGGANDESSWRGILEYFSPAVQLGLTATPKRRDNVDTYRYFGEPVYVYSLKEGINDGFLTPFKVKRIQTTLDSYIYVSDDTIIEGDVEEGRVYEEDDFNRVIEIKEREAERVRIILKEIHQAEKTIVFCATQSHAAAVRDLINQYKNSPNPQYCVRVTANDGEIGEQFLRDFQDNEKTIPTVLTTSQKLSTGVNARNIRNIVLMRPIRTLIEFKQIVGRGTRLFEGKSYFTIYDFVDAYKHFADPEWDGEPLSPEDETCLPKAVDARPTSALGGDKGDDGESSMRAKLLRIKLADGKEREIQHMVSTSFWSPDGKPLSAEEFLKRLYGSLPSYFKNEDELRKIWSDPGTRKALLERLAESGIGKDDLVTLQSLIDAEKSDLFDVLEYVSFAVRPITREARVASAKAEILAGLGEEQRDFVEFVLSKYIESGVDELDQEKLPSLLELKYQALSEATETLGSVETIRSTFLAFQKKLYAKRSGDTPQKTKAA
jgi:type I restriction enzyme R subunit